RADSRELGPWSTPVRRAPLGADRRRGLVGPSWSRRRRYSPRQASYRPPGGQRDVGLRAVPEDDVIVYGQVEQPARVDQLTCQPQRLPAGLRVALRVVVHENDRGDAENPERRPEVLPRVDRWTSDAERVPVDTSW